jgi:serine/threonine-protein kinase RsbW
MEKRIKIESSINNLRVVENAIDELVNEVGIPQENYGKIMVSTLEAVNNAIMHGNKYEREKLVDIRMSFRQGKLRIKVTDEGNGFEPASIPDPTLPQNIESLNGRGVFLMSKLADQIKYSKKGNAVTMYFKNVTI